MVSSVAIGESGARRWRASNSFARAAAVVGGWKQQRASGWIARASLKNWGTRREKHTNVLSGQNISVMSGHFFHFLGTEQQHTRKHASWLITHAHNTAWVQQQTSLQPCLGEELSTEREPRGADEVTNSTSCSSSPTDNQLYHVCTPLTCSHTTLQRSGRRQQQQHKRGRSSQ